MQECRCSECNKLLAKLEGRAEIICTRCKVLNTFGVPSEEVDTSEVKEWCEALCKANYISAASIIANAYSKQ
ncbi:Com family DNA-binding transcriptional regulator [Streptomyces sp. SID8380]|nr:Com family DNA-binding transcriptional regulator [Streptomyces sp. SID8380]